MSDRKSLKVLSCVPRQLYSFEDKFNWVEEQIKIHKPDIVITPQEWHGGISTIFFPQSTEKVAYSPEELTLPYVELSRKHGVGICTGALIDDPVLNERRERIYVIDPEKGVTGFNDKFALPAYDHVDAGGLTKVFPETNLANRAVAHECCGARLGILFCWESHGFEIWQALHRARPDTIISMIKFGVSSWPQKEKTEKGESIVTGFGYGDDGDWIRSLQYAAWQLVSPVINSTNSWNLKNSAGALAGTILPWEEKESKGEWARPARSSTLWNSKDCGAGLIEEHVQCDVVDFLYWRLIREHKFTLFEATNEWPSSEARRLTMRWKVRRLEARMVGMPKLSAPEGKGVKIRAKKGSHIPDPSVFQ